VKELIVHSAAKVNLTLDVLSRRRDGYHELQSVVHAVGLWDTLTFDFEANRHHKTAITVGCNDQTLANENNLCLKAARAWLEAVQNKGHNHPVYCHIQLEKRIPHGAGLGGGSGNAAATLAAFNKYHREVLSESEMLRVAAKIGADVPFFLMGGAALMEGIGDRLSPLPALDGWLVIVQGAQTLSTPAVYSAWDEMNEDSGRATPIMLEALGDTELSGMGMTLEDLTRAPLQRVDVAPAHLKSVARALGNDLQSAAQILLPDLQEMAALLRVAGALGVQMTGSGSAVFGLFENESEAKQATQFIRVRKQKSKLYLPFVEAAPFCREALRFEES
jgi:4-diphosphocytidyl-2-C-methyl-D-erythritol kinase